MSVSSNPRISNIHSLQNIPSNLQQRRLSSILPTLNNFPPHHILNKRPNSRSRTPRPTNSKHQLPINSNRISTEDRRRNVRGLLSLELGHSRADSLGVNSRAVYEDLVLEGMA